METRVTINFLNSVDKFKYIFNSLIMFICCLYLLKINSLFCIVPIIFLIILMCVYYKNTHKLCYIKLNFNVLSIKSGKDDYQTIFNCNLFNYEVFSAKEKSKKVRLIEKNNDKELFIRFEKKEDYLKFMEELSILYAKL